MILHSLHVYYQAQVVTGNLLYAPAGMELKRIHFVLVLGEEGLLVDIEQPEEKVCVAKSLARGGKDSALIANRMWDNVGYITGYGSGEKQQNSAILQHRSFRELVSRLRLTYPHNECFAAVAAFYTKYSDHLRNHPLWKTIVAKPGHNITFRLRGENILAAQQPELLVPEMRGEQTTCLVDGKISTIALIHPKVYVPGGAPTGCKLVSFTKGFGYESYYKQAGENAPISVAVAEGYSAALTGMMQMDSANRVTVGNISFLFFSLPINDFSSLITTLLNPVVKQGRKAAIEQLKHYINSTDECTLLALVPNVARLSVRLFVHLSVAEVTHNLLRFYNEMEIEHSFRQNEPPAAFMPLFIAAPLQNVARLPQQIVIAYLQAVVCGTPFPQPLQHELLGRQREQKEENLMLISLLRCYMNRNSSTKNIIPMALDKSINNTGYLLGRTFAILERTQELSQPGINFTVRDTYYTMASVTPSAVFNRLIGLSTAHFRRITSKGTATYMKIQLGEVTNQLDGRGFPTRLSLDDQSHFALGYFHQRQTYFKKIIPNA